MSSSDLKLNDLFVAYADMETVIKGLRKCLGYSIQGISLTTFFPKVLNILNQNKIDFVIAGGFARSLYAEPRLTQDIDITIATTDLQKVEDTLLQNSFTKKDILDYSKPSKRIIRKYLFEDKELDIVIFEPSFNSEILATAKSGNLLGNTVKVVSPEMLVVQKMLSFRNKDKADIIEIRNATKLDMEKIRSWSSKLKMFDRLSIFEEEKE